ncbi:DUF305 domain-containing protein [Mycobacterium sp. 852002-51057_SCH5723018]|uniref:DUF305 domain-containing protein n=1 Tax=Mycobacterium sp. 852002-51057_SCH5723018 TaxID=1834094 RepID=UPI0007FB843F|nr:DUF305 domain-containing protein [Mycobacterium sp. 852002-51057_SCH5723018]OBG30303.1 hypothetical protein A5764_19925 [Mycobacterium sp. 852002-51057_SCH5723018]
MPSKSVCVLAAVLLTVVIPLTSCGHAAVGPHGGQSESRTDHDGRTGAHNGADVAFAANMLPHHQQGVLLAAMVPAHTLNPDLRVIAAHIAADQQAEIQTLNLLLAQWHEHPDADHGFAAGHDAMRMAGMVDQDTIDRLQSLDGAAFDTLWAKSMISHHQGAVTMAQAEIAHGQSVDAIHTATLIVDAQQREIATMTHLISLPQ